MKELTDISGDEKPVNAAETSAEQLVKMSTVAENWSPTETEFGAYLLSTINELLCQGGASTADAVRYAFHNRWMPEKLKSRDVCETLYHRYIDDIEQANQKIKQGSASNANDDIVVAVGLAWFTNLYLCYQLVETEGDI